jgi:hypothetical protein
MNQIFGLCLSYLRIQSDVSFAIDEEWPGALVIDIDYNIVSFVDLKFNSMSLALVLTFGNITRDDLQ